MLVANGDLGRIEDIRGRQLVVELSSPTRLVGVPLGKAADREDDDEAGENGEEKANTGCNFDLAYAVTCHKYQGSEVPVAIVLVEGVGKLGSREWIYTAISRARSLCVLVGERAEMARYTRNCTLPDRKTFLAELLKGEVAA